jgi:hypothetical protein
MKLRDTAMSTQRMARSVEILQLQHHGDRVSMDTAKLAPNPLTRQLSTPGRQAKFEPVPPPHRPEQLRRTKSEMGTSATEPDIMKNWKGEQVGEEAAAVETTAKTEGVTELLTTYRRRTSGAGDSPSASRLSSSGSFRLDSEEKAAKREREKQLAAVPDGGARGMAQIHTAAQNDNVERLQKLVEKAGAGVGADERALFGMTPLMLAASQGAAAALRFLLSAGAAVDLQDVDGHTALMWAVGSGHKECADLLRDLGKADANIKDATGQGLEQFEGLHLAAGDADARAATADMSDAEWEAQLLSRPRRKRTLSAGATAMQEKHRRTSAYMDVDELDNDIDIATIDLDDDDDDDGGRGAR